MALRFVRRKGRIADLVSERFVLWEDTAPFPVSAEYVAKGSPFRLSVWNVWEGPHGATLAWTANAGMTVEEQQSGLLQLGCSAGPGEVRPADCRVSLSWSSDVEAHLETPFPPQLENGAHAADGARRCRRPVMPPTVKRRKLHL